MTKPCLALLALALISLPSAPARAQGAATLPGTCQRLVIADQDLGAGCKGSLLRIEAPAFTSYLFSGPDGRSLSFAVTTGEGGEAGERPVGLVTPGLTSREGIARSPTPATGTCRVGPDGSGGTAIACEARAQGRLYAGAFLAAPPAAPPGAARP